MVVLVQVLVRLVGLACTLALVCAGPGVFGGIPPETFVFKNVVPLGDGGLPDGWKATQVLISLNRMTEAGPISVVCPIEVGVPETNRFGKVTDKMVQLAAAAASDEAARVALGSGALFSAQMCDLFRTEMEIRLKEAIPGATVTRFLRTGLPRATFP